MFDVAFSTLTITDMGGLTGGDGDPSILAAPAAFTIVWAVNRWLDGEKPLDILKEIF